MLRVAFEVQGEVLAERVRYYMVSGQVLTTTTPDTHVLLQLKLVSLSAETMVGED